MAALEPLPFDQKFRDRIREALRLALASEERDEIAGIVIAIQQRDGHCSYLRAALNNQELSWLGSSIVFEAHTPSGHWKEL